jgi:hypothetical protein
VHADRLGLVETDGSWEVAGCEVQVGSSRRVEEEVVERALLCLLGCRTGSGDPQKMSDDLCYHYRKNTTSPTCAEPHADSW